MTIEYRDRWIECDGSALRIRGYYFPWGTKTIERSKIRDIRRIDLDVWNGRWRIWGSSSPRHRFNLDPRRPSKSVGLVLDVGARIQPVLTPDEPDRLEQILRGARSA